MATDGAGDQGFAGTLKNFHLSDIIQMCCLSMSSLTIHVSHDDNFGTITIDSGQIVHAQYEDQTGVDAFYKIMCWGGGNFEALDLQPYAEKTIQQNSQFLLMEAARYLDEVLEKEDRTVADVKSVEKKIRVLIVDDSPIMGKILTSVFTAQGDIEVVGVAGNGEQALKMIDRLQPDLIALDINMPVMDGSTALKHIMIKKPCPVVIMSNLGDSSHITVMDFLNLGAVDFMSKPIRNKNIVLQQQKIVERLRFANEANINAFRRVRLTPSSKKPTKGEQKGTCDFCVIVNSGAGGHVDLISLLIGLSKVPQIGICSLQTIPPAFVQPFSEYVDRFTDHNIIPIQEGNPLMNGQAVIGNNGVPITLIQKESGQYEVSVGTADYRKEGHYFSEFLDSVV